MRILLLVVSVVFGNLTQRTPAQDVRPLADWLAAPILEQEQTLRDVQRFCESRVPPVPQVSSVAEWERFAAETRRLVLDHVVFRGAAADWRMAETRFEYLDTMDGGPEYRIRKLRYEAVPGLWIPALLYEPKQLNGRVPVVLNVNGHDGKGKAAEYKQIRCINQAKRGLLALNVEWIGMGQLRSDDNLHYRMNQLDLCGTSGLAPFYLSLSRGIDVLLSHEHADPERVAVAGLSGGGWQTIVISALDERVTLSDPVAGYSSFRTRARHQSDLGDSEQTPVDLALFADYATLTAMRAPRPTLLTFNAKDNCCFASAHALPPLLNAAVPIYELYEQPGRLRWHVNEDPGDHNFGRENREAFYQMLGDFFFTEDASFAASEIPCDDEVRDAEALHVELPESNATLHSLALAVSASLPAPADAPNPTTADGRYWRSRQQRQLRERVRARHETVRDAKQIAAGTSADGWTVTQWSLNVSHRWTVPLTVVDDGAKVVSGPTVILLADGGCVEAADAVAHHVAHGACVIALDPFLLGQSRIHGRDFLYALLVSAVGDRPLGIQAGQIHAVADWARDTFGRPVVVEAHGHRTSLMALVAAAMDDAPLVSVTLHDCSGSLTQVLDQNLAVNQEPELFCFGLLPDFDIPRLIAIAGDDRVTMHAADAP